MWIADRSSSLLSPSLSTTTGTESVTTSAHKQGNSSITHKCNYTALSIAAVMACSTRTGCLVITLQACFLQTCRGRPPLMYIQLNLAFSWGEGYFFISIVLQQQMNKFNNIKLMLIVCFIFSILMFHFTHPIKYFDDSIIFLIENPQKNPLPGQIWFYIMINYFSTNQESLLYYKQTISFILQTNNLFFIFNKILFEKTIKQMRSRSSTYATPTLRNHLIPQIRHPLMHILDLHHCANKIILFLSPPIFLSHCTHLRNLPLAFLSTKILQNPFQTAMMLQHLLVVTSALFTCPTPDIPTHLHMHLSQSPLLGALSQYAHIVTEETSVSHVLILIPKIPGIARTTSFVSPSFLASTRASHAKVPLTFGTGRILPILLSMMSRFSLISRHYLQIIYTIHLKTKKILTIREEKQSKVDVK